MPIVYVSSTYRDLKPYREAAARAARAFECETLAMEDYVAKDERPLDKCLADVRRSDIYVGIIAKRYGYRPPGQTKSITQLEYEAAHDKTRLIFFLEDDVAWDDGFTDTGDDAAALAGFRNEVQQRHLGKPFTSPDNLEARVSQALGMYLKARREEIPSLLPYLSDRSDQTDELAVALDTWKNQASRRPVVAVIHGDADEAHSMFLDRLRQRILPQLLKRGAEDPLPKRFVIEWSDAAEKVEKRLGRLHARTMEAIVGRRGPPDLEELVGAVSRLQSPAMVTTSILSTDWQANEEELIHEWVKWWGTWPDLPSRQLLTVLITVEYRPVAGGLLSRLTRSRDHGRNRRAQEAVERLDFSDFPGVVGVTLDRLEGVKESHIRAWFDTHVKEFCRASPRTVPSATILEEKLMPEVRKLFQDREHIDEEGRISMDMMATTLRRMLQDIIEESLVEGGRG